MQTFLPLPDVRASLEALDDRRLGKQRVETFQILRALTWPRYAWKNHPAVRMWRGFVPALVAYGVANCDVWTARGYGDTVRPSLLEWSGGRVPDLARLRDEGRLPPWLGLPEFHLSHQSALVRKDPSHYRPLFPDAPDDLPYYWPPDVFPRWPARRPAGAAGVVALPEVLAILGLDQPRAGQAEAVEAVLDGRDVLVTMAPGHGGSTTGLLAGLSLGRTVAILPAADALLQPFSAEPLVEVEHRDEVESSLPEADVAPEVTERAPGATLARPPGEADRAAMVAEATRDPDFAFLGPRRLARAVERGTVSSPALVLVDDAAELDDDAALREAVAAVGRPPVVAVTGAAGPERRAELTGRLGLVDPVHAGGGFDRPAVHLAVQVLSREAERRAALVAAVRGAGGPGLVRTPDRVRAERATALLARSGVRAAAVATGMRASRVREASTRYRSRRLDALVVAAGAEPELGRGAVEFLVTVGPPPDLDAYFASLALARPRAAGGRAPATLLITDAEVAGLADSADPGARALARYAAATGCRRAALLDAYGEPVRTPCGGCDRCAA